MPDYGHALEFGFFLDPASGDPARTLESAVLIDELGFDLIGIQDHPYQPKHIDALTLSSFVLAQTSRVRVFPDVANLPLRPPLMLAKQAASIDLLSGGRFELGLGAGAFRDAIGTMGGPIRKPAEALAALEEGVDLMRSFWSQSSLRTSGEFYQAIGTRPGPAPAHDISVWLGVVGPRALALTGRIGDGWVPSMSYVPPTRAVESNRIIDQAARAAGRHPSAIRRIYNIGGDISPVQEADWTDDSQHISGPVAHWVDVLTHLATNIGFSTFVLWGVPSRSLLRLFIEEIAPAVRDRVTEVRASRT